MVYYWVSVYHINRHMYEYTGWWYTYPSEKYDFVSWDDDILNIYIYIIWKNKTCSKPPTKKIYIYL